ncbi:MAG: DEAD/DEAH box helicase [Planctomycetota bacterium]|nr:DEAD/DEAH box helicase [Planctomycetota bacterium]
MDHPRSDSESDPLSRETAAPRPAEEVAPPPSAGGERRRRSTGSVLDLARALRADPELRDGFEHWRESPARPARTVALPERLDPRLAAALAARGLSELFEHQGRAIEAALAGRDVLVATPTASGKTLCYTVPLMQRLFESGGSARALLLFPTKALGQDQSAGLTELVAALGQDWHAATYDGDTPVPVRRTLRDRGHMILTNPWMLHSGILPNHARWSELFRDLETIVIDEVHTLSGVFGSSVANVLRRLVRIARHYGSEPRFVCCSATLRDGAEHARRLLGREVEVVDRDASPCGRRLFTVYSPPLLDPVAGLRANALEEARRLARHLVGPRHQTIFFCRRRTAVEVLTRYLKEAAGDLGLRPEEVRGYRGGYLPLLRREIEAGLRSGEVKVVVSTNALELGIDIGALDVAVLVGYPGSQASFWQRAGRVGRRGKPSLVVQVAQADPVDQYLVRHPEALFSEPRERLAVDPDNLVILSEQLKCAAFELPFALTEGAGADTTAADVTATDEQPRAVLDDVAFGGVEHAVDVLDYLAEESGLLHAAGGRWYWMADAYPAQDVSLEGGEADNVVILDAETNKAVGEIDREGSLTTVHEGAIYQVEGRTWIVERFDHANRRATVREVDTDYFTDAQTETEVRVLRLEVCKLRCRGEAAVEDPVLPAPLADEDAGGPVEDGDPAVEDHAVWRGEVHVTTLATQYKKIRFYTRENVGAESISLPPEELDTEAFVLTLSERTASELGLHAGSRGAGWHGVGNLLRRVAPLFVRCQPSDLGLSTQVRAPHFKRPALFLHDRVQGGVGLADLLFDAHRELLEAALEVVSACRCRSGCPACVGPPEQIGAEGKDTARRVLEHLARGALPRDAEVPAGRGEECVGADAGGGGGP